MRLETDKKREKEKQKGKEKGGKKERKVEYQGAESRKSRSKAVVARTG